MARVRRGAVAWSVVLVLAGCSSSHSSTTGAPAGPAGPSGPPPAVGAVPWPAPPNPLERARAAGLVPEPHETLVHHVHAHLDVFVDGVAVTVPAGIGINIDDPAVHRGLVDGAPAYGGISPPCAQPCISPLHTHDVTGILHTESATNVDNTLGQFFTEWDVVLTTTCVGGYCSPQWQVAVYVDGQRFSGDPGTIALSNRKEIAIVIGRPPATIPSSTDLSQA